MNNLKEKCYWLKTELLNALRQEHVDRKKVTTIIVLVTSLYIGSVMMFFGMNFWLWSFTSGIKRSYASILVPSLLWAAFFLTTVGIDVGYKWYRDGEKPDLFFWWSPKGRSLVGLIGLFDSLTGLAGMYASVHVPQLMQSALISTGPIWTFILAAILFPSSQPPFHPILIGVLVAIVCGVFFALLPQVLDKQPDKKYFSAPWALVYLLATAFFPLYNVLQGRFLHEYRNHGTSFSRKMIMLASETSVQLVLTLFYFPLDSLPYFGKCSSLSESWSQLGASLTCISSCPNNGLYMMIYVTGFWIRHIVFAYLNTYSPSVAAVTSMLTQPLNAFLMLAFPVLNVYGSKKNWGLAFLCFLFLLTGMLLFMAWHLMFKTRQEGEGTAVLEDTLMDERDMGKSSTVASDAVIVDETDAGTVSPISERPAPHDSGRL